MMAAMNIEQRSTLTDQIENKLDEADWLAENTDERLEHDEVFDKFENIANENKQ